MKTALLLLVSVACLSAQSLVSPQFFGMTVSQNAGITFPTLNVQPVEPHCVRAWDSATGWADIETSAGVYNWAKLDTFIANAGGNCVLWTIGKTPQFYSPVSSDPSCAEINHSCDGVVDVAANGTGTDAHFQAFITAAFARYGSKIPYIEIWNEANNTQFCTNAAGGGTALSTCTAQALLRMLFDAKAIYTTATFTAPSMCVCNNTVFTNSTSTATNSADGVAYFLAASIMAGSVTGANTSPIIATHQYVGNNPATNISGALTNVKSAMTAAGVGSLPLWVTENSWGLNTTQTGWGPCAASPPFTQTCMDNMAAFVGQSILIAAGKGVSQYDWYAWGNQTHGTLYDATSGLLLTQGIAWKTVQRLLQGTTISTCAQASTVWTCAITGPNGLVAEWVWDTSQTCTPCTTSTYSVPMTYQGGSTLDLAGDPASVTGTTVGIGIKPILLTNSTCAITSPTSGQLWQTPTALQMTATVAAAPSAWRMPWIVNYRRRGVGYQYDQHDQYPDFPDAFNGVPWSIYSYPALDGDTLSDIASAYVEDIQHNQIAQCPAVTYGTRVEGMSNQSVNSLPNLSGNTISGVGKYGFLPFDGHNNGTPARVDGRILPQNCGAVGGTSQPGGGQTPAMDTTCGFTNGPHLITSGYNQTNIKGTIGEPYIIGATITSVSGTSIYLGGATNCPFLTSVGCHYSVQTTTSNPDVVTFSTTGTQYTGVNNGTQCYWAVGTGFCSVTVSIAGGVATFTCSPACGPTASNQPVYVRNIQSTSQTTGLPNCDGLYNNETFISSTSFSIPVNSACNGAAANLNLEVDWNPYFANNVDAFHISVSASTDGSSPISLSGSCTGSCTVNQRIRSIYWTGANSSGNVSPGTDFPTNGGPANITVQPIFANGSSPMEIRPSYWEYHGWPGKTGDTLAAITENTDLSSSACGGACSYFAAADGTVTGAISVNSSTGAITYAATSSWSNPSAPTSWAQATVICPTCIPSQSVSTTGTASSGAMSLTVPSASLGIVVGEAVTGTGLAPDTLVTSITTGTTINLSQATTGTLSSTAIIFSEPVTVYIEEDPGTSAIFPHYCTNGAIVNSFTWTSSCHSFFPTGVQDAAAGTSWQGPAVYTNGHFNTLEVGLSGGSDQRLIDPTATSCPGVGGGGWPDSVMTTNQNFATQYGLSMIFNMYDVWFNLGEGISNSPYGGGLGPILANTGYNRRACLSTFVNYMVSTGLYFGFKNDDETTFQTGVILRMNPTIRAAASVNTTWDNGWTSAAVSGTGLIFNVVNPQGGSGNIMPPWSQSAGTGSWIQIVNATNTCLNGWYPILTSNSTQWTSNNRGSCANGTYKPSGGILETTAQIAVNQSPLNTCCTATPSNHGANNQQNQSALPGNLGAINQHWDSTLTSIVVSSCVATINWTGHGIPAGTAIRIWLAATSPTDNLNIVAPVNSGASHLTNSFTITYPNIGTGEACPANNTYNSSTDPLLTLTVDPNWGPDALGTFFSIINAVTGAPSTVMSIQGGNFGNPPTVYSYDGNPANVGGAFVYNGGSPTPYLGDSAGVWQNINFDTEALGNAGGLFTRAYQLKPRGVLWGWGVINGGYALQTTCRSFTFNPGCDRPVQNTARPEEMIAQIFGGKSHNYVRFSNYNLMTDTADGYNFFCCGIQQGVSNGSTTGTGGALNPYIAPKAFKAGALANAMLQLTAHTELEPEANKPFWGSYFSSDAHTSSTYGNSIQITCGAESAYGVFPITLSTFTSGSVIQYLLNGYSLQVVPIPANPSTVTQEWCATPGLTSILVAQPSGYTALDTPYFPGPTLPSGATNAYLRVGYYAPSMQDDPVTPCSYGCMPQVAHGNLPVYYQWLFTNATGALIGSQNPTPSSLPSQGNP